MNKEEFAEKTIADEPDAFSHVEVNGVEFVGENSVDINNQDPDIYSVYLRYSEGGCVCIADFDTRDEAVTYATKLAEKHEMQLSLFV